MSPGGQQQNGTRSPNASNADVKSNAPKNNGGTISSRDAKGRGLSSCGPTTLVPILTDPNPHPHSQSSPPTDIYFSTGEGFNWSDNFRTRAERNSVVGQAGVGGGSPGGHARAKSVAVMEPPIDEMPKARPPQRPDYFQERILKGEFYMD